jgi:hypothetical protein
MTDEKFHPMNQRPDKTETATDGNKVRHRPVRKRLSAMGNALGVIALTTAAFALVCDKSLPYRIGPSHYAQYLWVGRLAGASLVVAVPALALGIVFRRWQSIGLALLAPVLLALMGGAHPGPMPQVWCHLNLLKIERAKQELAFQQHLTNGTVVTVEQILLFLDGGPESLKCAEHGKYLLNPIGTEPCCTFHGSISGMDAQWKGPTGDRG